MSGTPWTPKELACFLHWTQKMPARSIAMQLNRTIPAIMSMRRKLMRLQKLGAEPAELEGLLAVNEAVVMRGSLKEIRRFRASMPLVQVKHYLRRGRDTGKPHLVEEHVRAPVEKGE